MSLKNERDDLKPTRRLVPAAVSGQRSAESAESAELRSHRQEEINQREGLEFLA